MKIYFAFFWVFFFCVLAVMIFIGMKMLPILDYYSKHPEALAHIRIVPLLTNVREELFNRGEFNLNYSI